MAPQLGLARVAHNKWRKSGETRLAMTSPAMTERMSRNIRMNRRAFITIAGGAAMWPRAVRAQQAALPVIGYLDSRSPDAVAGRLRAFRQGLQQAGFVEGENVAILYRFAENQMDRLPELAADLARRQVALIAAPAGATAALAAKRLELLREMMPKARRVAVLVNPADARRTEVTLQDLEPAARTMGVQMQVLNANTANEIDAAFETISREQPDALFVAPTPFLNVRLVQLAQLAAFHRLPSTHDVREYAEVGGLMSYGSNIGDTYRQVGVYAGRILKGAKTADLPVVQSSKFELVINVRTARMLGVTVPDKLLVAADEVIE